jgi:transcriptional regulatory protein RtcR
LARRARSGERKTESDGSLDRLLEGSRASALDRFDRIQLEEVVRVCRSARSLSEAGRVLFAASRATRATTNDADRLRKYLARCGLTLQAIQAA